MSVPGYKDVILADAPVAYWRLGDSGLAAADLTGNGHVGTLHGGVTTGVAGAPAADPDPAMLFDGSSGWISVPYSAGLYPAAVSIEVLARWTAAPAAPGFAVDALNSSHAGYRVLLSTSGQITSLFGTGVSVLSLATPVAPSLNAFHQIVATVDGANASLYIDGARVIGPTACAYSANGTLGLGIGDPAVGGAAFFGGSIDEVAIYNYALTAAQVLNHYNAFKVAMLDAVPLAVRTRDGLVTLRAR